MITSKPRDDQPITEQWRGLAVASKLFRRWLDDVTEALSDKPRAFLYVSGNTTATTVSVTQTYYPVTAASSELSDPAGNPFNRFFSASNSRITALASLKPGWFRVTVSACLSIDATNQQTRMRIGKNGTTLPESCAQDSVTGNPGSGRRESLGTHTMAWIEPGDYLEVFVGEWTSTNDILVRNMQFSVTPA